MSTTQQHSTTQHRKPLKTCPVCGARLELDYHHWTYKSRRGEAEKHGFDVCRNCHNYIHQDVKPREVYSYTWWPRAMRRLVELHLENHYSIGPETIRQKYDIPDRFKTAFHDIVCEYLDDEQIEEISYQIE